MIARFEIPGDSDAIPAFGVIGEHPAAFVLGILCGETQISIDQR